MNRAHDVGGIDALVFHDVDLPGSGPRAVGGALRHQPEGGPIPFADGQPGPDFETSIFLAEVPARPYFGGSIAAALVGLALRDDMKKPVADVNVLRPGRVVLQ